MLFRSGGGRGDVNHLAACDVATYPKTPRVPNAAVAWDGFAFGIDKWDRAKVEAALKARGLSPVFEGGPNGYESFLVKDPGGLNVWITNGNKKNRRTTAPNGKLNVPLPFEPTGYKTVYLDHISFQARDYKLSVAFYEALLGWKGLGDEGSQNETEIAPDIGGLLIRGGNSLAPGFTPPTPGSNPTPMDHISFGITPFDPDEANAALCKRGLSIQADTGATGDIHVTEYKSYHTTTPNGFNLQFSNKITPTKP